MGSTSPVDMTPPTEKFKTATDQALCAFLSATGGGALNYAIWGLATPGPFDEGLAASYGGLALAAYAIAGCPSWDSGALNTLQNPNRIDGCAKVASAQQLYVQLKDKDGNNEAPPLLGFPQEPGQPVIPQAIKQIVAFYPWGYEDPRQTVRDFNITVIDQNDVQHSSRGRLSWNSTAYIGDGTACEVVDYPGDPAGTYTYNYTDAGDSCQIDVTFQGWAATSGNNIGAVWKLEPPTTLKAQGGIIGGCNFEPVIYYAPPPGGPPPVYGPWNPDWDGGGDGTPPWRDFVNDLVAGFTVNATYSALEKLFETKYPANSREIYAACENKADGSPETFSVNFPEETFNDRVLTALDAIVDFQQQFFLWKTPICKDTPTPQTGDAVTINWISDERSLASGDFLRKLFTYFDHNNSTLEATVAHWRNFTWQAGPVIVSCVGTQLGKPQVWAASEEEAKRVINHAAAIAGIDTSGAEWLVAAPKSSRYGQPGLMRVQRGVGGVLGITKRGGPSGFPEGLT